MAKQGEMIKVRKSGSTDPNDWESFTPHTMTWGLQDISKSTSGRDQSGLMHKERLSGANGQKRKLELSWAGTDRVETRRILKAFNPEYIEVDYPDAMAGDRLTKTFYVGDRSAMVWTYHYGNNIYESVSFDIIEV